MYLLPFHTCPSLVFSARVAEGRCTNLLGRVFRDCCHEVDLRSSEELCSVGHCAMELILWSLSMRRRVSLHLPCLTLWNVRSALLLWVLLRLHQRLLRMPFETVEKKIDEDINYITQKKTEVLKKIIKELLKILTFLIDYTSKTKRN